MKHDGPGTADAIRADLNVGVQWKGGYTFDGGKAGAPAIRLDGHSKAGPSPPEVLLVALGTCAAIDVVAMLNKRRTPPASMDLAVTAERTQETPRRVTRAHLAFRITGEGIDQTQTMRAIRLAVTRYCTVRDTLDPELPVTWSLELG